MTENKQTGIHPITLNMIIFAVRKKKKKKKTKEKEQRRGEKK